ncbi:unnamed protein product [Caenorhabditis angaria]|uniref:Uncharacterized protein n=1 Tax=Caenorhabditis angaria TaxID=860376 RepID=A0A9P1MZE5_9PELO|nr:unnamed protein product [Caenorhabditis angaria]
MEKSVRSAKPKVTITGKVPEKKAQPATATSKTEVTAPPPTEGFQIRDEVEMLRAGFKNRHGEAVKSQGVESMNIELN